MIFKSPHPDVEIPETSLRPLVLRHAERLGNKVAIVEVGSGRSYTYAELASNATKLVGGFRLARAVSTGSRKYNIWVPRIG